MKFKEEACKAAIELVQNQAHRNLKIWMESDPNRVNEIQECQPAIRKEDSDYLGGSQMVQSHKKPRRSED